MNNQNVKAISPLFDITVRKLGIVARDYNIRFPNGYRDFSHAMLGILDFLDAEGCDTALFSLYSLVPRPDYDLLPMLGGFKRLRMIGVEEFKDGRRGRKAGYYVVYYHAPGGWKEYRFKQIFGRVNWQAQADAVKKFVEKQIPRRVIGTCCFLVCGESNGVKYDKAGGRDIIDPYGVREGIPAHVEVLLNPVHDKMTRFEMMMKRRFLSEGGRTVVSVWNKGKVGKSGMPKNELGPAWTVFRDGEAVSVPRVENALGVEIGVLDIGNMEIPSP